MRIRRFALFLVVAGLITPILGSAQSQAVENQAGSGFGAVLPTKTDPPATPVNNSVVSVRELKMAGKGESAFQKGTRLLLKGDARGSLAYFERTLAKDPGYYRAYHNLGLAQYQLGDRERAEDSFQRAIDLTKGGFAPSEFALGMILFEKREFPQAEALIQRGLALDPGSSIGEYFLGVVQLALNRVADAERSAQEALLRSADQAEAHILLAQIHQRDHNPYAVEADVAAYLKVDPHGRMEKYAHVLLQRAQKEISENPDAGR